MNLCNENNFMYGMMYPGVLPDISRLRATMIHKKVLQIITTIG